ncbi:NADPH:quinone reductase [Raphidocelis subcapitata]|uniref:NADPH:quinone reductase n=1 Tax=Raphidocelis subcapitata TaxID=307507 RepID=A0A2V0PFB6_9CHLO|nr:NADPH:quinone reductase [Raphidocelis subcapitata]|eukprot:GBF96603.1 NADPH:quinone reductase [Raphidocelis subcapitata]
MRAAVLRAQGPPDALRVEPDWPRPPRRPGEVLIRVAAAGVNPVDAKTRSGLMPRAVVALPRILGADVAGVVEEADAGSGFAKGDAVMGCTGQHFPTSKWGTYAELVAAPAASLVPIPPGTSFEAAAAAPLAALTAWQALAPRMPLAGRAVLVHAGAGGVGSFAIQIAKAQGARVTATCSGRNAELVTKALGADRAVDYTRERFEEAAPGPYDVIVDTVGGDYEPRGLPLLRKAGGGRPRGHYVNLLTHGWCERYGPRGGMALNLLCAAKGLALPALRLGPSYALVSVDHRADRGLRQVAQLMAEGKVKPLVDRVFPLGAVSEAHALSDSGRARGKIVLKVADL